MANQKISDMLDIGAPTGTDQLPIVRPGDTTNYSITMAGIAAYAQGALIPGVGLVYSTGSAFADATMGAGVSFNSGTLSNTGVLQTGSLTGSIALGPHMTTAGGSLDATGFAAVPSAGVVYSNGTILSAAAMGAGVTQSGGTLSNTGVLAVGTITGSVPLGSGLDQTGGTLSNSGVLQVGTLTGAIPIGANLTTTGGTLNATGFGSMSSWVAGTNLAGGTITNGATASLSPAITITDTTAKIVLDRNTGGTLDTLGSIYFHVVGADGVNVKDGIDGFGAVPQYIVRRAGGTRQTKTAIQSGDTLGLFGAAGYDGTAYSFGGASSANMQAGMAAVAVQNWTTAAHGVNLVFSGIPSNSTTVTGFGTLSSTGLILSGGTIIAASNSIVVGGNFSTAGVLSISPATWTVNNLVYASGTTTLGQLVLPTGWGVTSGTLVPSSTIVVGLSNSLADTIPAGTYDLGPFINGGTILNSYAHTVSGTIAFGAAIGQPGTYTDVTGLTGLTVSSTTIDTIGTATAANVIAAGAHAYLKITAGSPGGDIFLTVKVP